MKIVMPLFRFCSAYADIVSFPFSYHGLSLNQFRENDVVPLSGFSEMDIQHIGSAQWALVYQVDDNNYSDEYKEFVQLLLIAFRIFSDYEPPHIKYRICEENTNLSVRISMIMRHNDETEKQGESFDREHLQNIDDGFKHIQNMYSTSNRTKNALYFLCQAYMTEQWAVRFIMTMVVLESLFSNDMRGAAKEPICQRASSLLGSRERCAKKDIEKLYDLRCDIVHGRIEFNNEERNNLQELAHLEFVTTQCFRELIAQDAYKHYATKLKREQFMSKLDAPAVSSGEIKARA